MMTESKTLFDAFMVAMVFASGRLVQAKPFADAMMLFTALLVIVVVVSTVPDIDLHAAASSKKDLMSQKR